jgi:FlaA1/EpsC-like NDP-sugar epimerase
MQVLIAGAGGTIGDRLCAGLPLTVTTPQG